MAKKKLNSVIGVDIGSQSIKIAEIKNLGREITVSALGMVPTPEGTVDHTGVYDTDAIGMAIKAICGESGATARDLVISVAGQASVLVRTLEVPRMDGPTLKQHMEWEISRNIPFAESTVQSDYKAFPVQDAAATNMDVVMAISPQTAVDTLVGIAKKAGKAAHALDVEPLGIARILATGYTTDLHGETVCVVEIGAKTTAINMYKDGQLLLPRQVPVGGEQFTTAIANNLGVPQDEAERMKCEKAEIPSSVGGASFGGGGFAPAADDAFAPYNPFAEDFAAPAAAPATPDYGAPTDYSAPTDYGTPGDFTPPDYSAPADPTIMPSDEPVYASPFEEAAPAPAQPEANLPAPTSAASDEAIRIYNAMAGELDEFVAEVRRSIDYFKGKGGDVHRILLCGGGSNLKGLDSMLERAIGIKAEALDPFKGMAISAKKLEFGMLENHRAEYAVAVGNALHIAFD